MSTESWLFLFAALGALGGLATVLQVLGVRVPLARFIHFGKPSAGFAAVLSTIALILSAAGFYGSISGKARPIGTLLAFSDPIPTDFQMPFMVGQPTKFNLIVRNQGPQPNSENVAWGATLMLLPIPVSHDDESKRWNEFRKAAKPTDFGDLTISGQLYQTFETRTLTEHDVSDIRAGRLMLYVFGFITYRDTTGSHEVQYCSMLQPPATRPIWHTCGGVPDRTR